MALSQTSVMKLYNTVVEDVIAGVRDCFLDDGVDEQVLQELRHLWKSKLTASGAMELPQEQPEHQPPPIVQNFQKANGSNLVQKKTVTHVTSNDSHHATLPIAQQATNSMEGGNSHAGQQQTLSGNPGQSSVVMGLDPSNKVPVQLTLPPQQGVLGSQPRIFTIQIPASALHGNLLHQVLTGPIITATMNLPQPLAATLLQQHINAALSGQQNNFSAGGGGAGAAGKSQAPFLNLDGACDSSEDDVSVGEGGDSEVGEDEEEEETNAEEEEEEEREGEGGPEEEPLNSGDDVSDEDPSDMFDTDNVVVCQYDKITRSRNKWKFYLKDGIMNLGGKDFVFQKANGDAEW